MVDFFMDTLWPLAIILGRILGVVVPLLIAVAYLTYAERKIIAAMQLRVGPQTVGPYGLLQPVADALKLIHKEPIIPTGANTFLFLLAPVITFTLSLAAWAAIPFSGHFVIADLNVGILYLLAISSLGVYGVIIAGWASNSRYAFLGALRSAAQMISYELALGLVLVCILLQAGSLNLTAIVNAQQNGWFIWPFFPLFVIFMICALAETNRSPFDLPEAEAELVAGYNVEYSSMAFALFFLGEYANMILMSAIGALLFLGGWLPFFHGSWMDAVPGFVWFFVKISALLFIFLWVRATLPRYRYDQLMRLGWKILLPLTLGAVVLTASYVTFIKSSPVYTRNAP